MVLLTKFDTIRCLSGKLEEHIGNSTPSERRLLSFDETCWTTP